MNAGCVNERFGNVSMYMYVYTLRAYNAINPSSCYLLQQFDRGPESTLAWGFVFSPFLLMYQCNVMTLENQTSEE